MEKKKKKYPFKIAKSLKHKLESIVSEIFHDNNNNKIMMKCPFCNYRTSKTFNLERHKRRCQNKNLVKTIENKFLITIKPTIIENNFSNDNNNKNLNQNKIFIDNNIEFDNAKNMNNAHNAILKKLFNSCSYLNSQEINFGNYYIFDKHEIDSGTYGTVFFGCQKESNIRVAIKQIKDYEIYEREKGILTDIRGLGNFPEFYDSIEREENYYIIESLTGPSLDILLNICNGKFDLLTTINIGIEAMTNLEILHNCGYIHRDLKPNNLFFGSISKNNYKYKSCIGILDFGCSVSCLKQEKLFNKKGKFIRYGKKIYSSNNVLNNKPCQKIDDIISLFYILIKLHNGNLPWIKSSDGQNTINIENIKKIREKYTPEILCKNFPKKFREQLELLINSPQNKLPNYSEILKTFKMIREEYIALFGDNKFKFQWIQVLNDFNNKEFIFLTEASIQNIKEFINKYGLNLNEYMNFLIN